MNMNDMKNWNLFSALIVSVLFLFTGFIPIGYLVLSTEIKKLLYFVLFLFFSFSVYLWIRYFKEHKGRLVVTITTLIVVFSIIFYIGNLFACFDSYGRDVCGFMWVVNNMII